MGGGNSSCSQRGLGGLPLQPAGPSSLNDSTTSDYVFPDTVVWDSSQVQRVVALSIIMMFTLVGNSAIVAVLGRPRGTKRRSRVNLFILNLAIGDLAVGFFTQSSEMLFEVGEPRLLWQKTPEIRWFF
ncbi:hypothetical protein HPB48_020067 [Haemaphysalis longicornis]|uniref:G-protein coupled receptors family 1 profile domain-containing protein n=1 Tax=Haemaphysalis longicornis TaxID=44386 RepID=A0A9J6GDK8_HAELO|nr:hypothetical protein HPB48_020067 [Haemaphysalis longicornis]